MLTYGSRRILLQPGTTPGVQPFVHPGSLQGLLLWFDAAVGTYSDTGLTTPQASNGGAVAAWAPKQGSGNLVQVASGATLVTGAVNGLPAVRFNQAAYMSIPQFGANETQPYTLFVVVRKTAIIDAIQHIIMCRSDGSNANNCSFGFNTGTNSFRLNAGSSITKAITATNWNVGAGLVNAANSKLWANGGAPTTGNPGTRSISGLTVGSDGGTNGLLGGDVAEILVYSSGLTDAQVALVGDWLGDKYGVAWT